MAGTLERTRIPGGGQSQKLTAALLSVAINAGLISIEATIAVITGSLAVFADAGHSFFDLLASIAAVWGVRMASQPPDRSHPYGHHKFENLSSLFQVAMISLIALFIFGQVGFSLANGYSLEVSNWAIAIIAGTLIVDFIAARYIGSVADAYGSSALEADAFHFTTDLWTKLAALGGLIGARLGAEWIDPSAALVVAGIMVYTATRLGLRSTRVLLDAAPQVGVEERVSAILAQEAGSDGYHSLRMRQAGPWVFLDVALHMPDETTLIQAHEQAHRVAERLRTEIPEVREAIVHVEPEGHAADHMEDHYTES